MTTSRLPAVIDALVTAGRAFSGHRDPESLTVLTGIPVFDGPEYGIVGDQAVTWVCVGWSGDPDAPEDGGDAGQAIKALGNRSREERGAIRMRVVSCTGDRGDMQARRNACFAEMALFEDLCRSTTRLGLAPSWMSHSEVADRYTFRQEYTDGSRFTLNFAISFVANI